MVTLIIATRNRSAQVKACLSSVDEAGMRRIGAELIVVDNGSTDDTAKILSRFRDAAGFPVSIVCEPVPGKSRALNAGLAQAVGDTIAFIDDDCYLGERYLEVVNRLFDTAEYQYCGGRVLLYDPTDAGYAIVVGERFRFIPPGRFLRAGCLLGANMAFKRHVIETVGPFDPMFGPGTEFRCDDIDYLARASVAGFTGAYVPQLVVYHHHRRKRGPTLRQWRRADSLGRGAYYAKFTLAGRQRFLLGWLLETLKRPSPARLATELWGAANYLRYRWLQR